MNQDRKGIGRFMGASSGIFFVGTAQQRLASKVNGTVNIGPELLRAETEDYDLARLLPVDDGEKWSVPLPLKSEALLYIDKFFDCWSTIFPVLHQPTFRNEFEKAYVTPQESQDRAFMAILWLVIALGYRHALLIGETFEGAPDIDREGREPHFAENVLVYKDDVLGIKDLRTVQYQILLVLWFSYTGRKSMAFQITGSMIRLAFELGLHRNSRRFLFDPLATEMRRRVFWTCYLLDKYVSFRPRCCGSKLTMD
jgi:hypothetical protein